MSAKIIHGETHKGITKEYDAWSSMKKRCLCKTQKYYSHYGGRGIKICKRWINSYPNFLKDMGRCPKDKKSLGRINNNGDYKPSNCRWENAFEQQNNTRFNVFHEINGVKLTVPQWARKFGVCPLLVKVRMQSGHDLLSSLTRTGFQKCTKRK